MKINGRELSHEKETLLITLDEKSKDFQSEHSVLHDKMAYDLTQQLGIDMVKYEELSSVTPVRAKQFDDWTKEFLSKNPMAVVVYLGAGLDTRFFRVNPPQTADWFEVDFPEVIGLKSEIFPKEAKLNFIASDIRDSNWMSNIPQDRPIFIMAEGVLEYLDETEVRDLLVQITATFEHGTLAFDVMNSYAIDAGKEKLAETTQAVHKWKVDDVARVDALNPKLHRISSRSVYRLAGMKALPLKTRLLYQALTVMPNFKNMIQLLKYDF